MELPENIRVPLHTLQADIDYLFGRVAADGSVAAMMAATVRECLSQLDGAIRELIATTQSNGDRTHEAERPADRLNQTSLPTPKG